MNKAPFFTIGIPVYNAEKYLPLCLNSILSQSYRDFELILVNDGSTDGSLEICQSYQKSDPRIVVISQKNGGVSSASNRILEIASGKYIYLMDNDDEMYEGILQKAHDYLVEEEVDILHGGYYSSTPDEGLKLRLFRNHDIRSGFDTLHDFLQYEANVGFAATMWTKFVRADFWKESEVLFQSRYDGCQDWDVSRRLMRQAKTVRYVDDIILTWYHPREDSISTKCSFPMMKNCWRLTTDVLFEAFSELDDTEIESYEKKLIQNNSDKLWRMTDYSEEQQREIQEIIAPIRKSLKREYAPDRRTAFLFFLVRHFGCEHAATVCIIIRKLKHMVFRR